MVSSKETTPAGYLASLPTERRAVIEAVRAVVKQRLPEGYVEAMNWGMLCYEIPLSRYPDTYNKQPLMYIALAAQKNNYALYMQSVAGFPNVREALTDAYQAAGRKLDMGGGCLRFKSLGELPLPLIGDIVASTSVEQRIAAAEAGRSLSSQKKAAVKKASASKAPAKKAPATKAAAKKASANKASAKKAASKAAKTAPRQSASKAARKAPTKTVKRAAKKK